MASNVLLLLIPSNGEHVGWLKGKRKHSVLTHSNMLYDRGIMSVKLSPFHHHPVMAGELSNVSQI